MRKLFLFTILLSTLFASCKKSTSPTPTPITKKNDTTTDVYVVGLVSKDGVSSVPAYWKNGILFTLPVDAGVNACRAAGVAIVGNDIYIVGTMGTFPTTPCYWKNGILYKLPQPTASSFGSGCYSVAVNGTDVYILGACFSEDNGNVEGVVWKNSVPTILPGTGSNAAIFVTGLALDGNDVYVCGFSTDNINQFPVYWKNNVLNKFAGVNYWGEANAISIDKNHNVYIAGLYSSVSVAQNVFSCYWKNGSLVTLGDTYTFLGLSEVTSLAVDSLQNVYVAGYNYKTTQAGYWKNGQFIQVPVTSPSVYNPVYGIAVNGNNVYTAVNLGALSTSSTSSSLQYEAGYFKNSTSTLLQQGDYSSSSPYAITTVQNITN